MSAPAVPLARNRDFRLLWVGQSLSVLGSKTSGVAVPLLVLATTGSPSKAGLAGLVSNAPFVLLQLPAGVYVDRWNRRLVMLACDVGRSLALGTLAVALVTGRATFVLILVVCAVEGSLFVPFRLAEGAAVRAVVPAEQQLSDAISMNQARTYGASLGGEFLGGVLFGIRAAVPFAVDAISYVASMATVALIRTPLSAPASQEQRSWRRELREGLTETWRHEFLRTTTLLSTGSDFVINGAFLLAIVNATRHGSPPASIGLMFAISGAGGIAGAAAAPWLSRRIHSLTLVAAGPVWVGVPLLIAMVFTHRAITLGVLLGAMLFLWPLYNAVIQARWMRQIPDQLVGRVQSVASLLGWAPVPLAPLAAGVAIDRFGLTAATLGFAALMTATAIAATVNPVIHRESAAAT